MQLGKLQSTPLSYEAIQVSSLIYENEHISPRNLRDVTLVVVVFCGIPRSKCLRDQICGAETVVERIRVILEKEFS